jgi:hypothetical protein
MNLRHPDSVSFAYNTTAKSYTAGAGGFPIGDLNWFPTRKAAWITAGKPTTAVQGTEAGVPSRFTLEQNYPNPFNPSTTIEYALTKSERVSLTVFDVLGRNVATLVDGHRDAGVHRTVFDAGALPSGVYFFQLKAGTLSDSKKMLLTR